MALSFANREYELNQILKPGMELVVIDAPAGYGKSELLREAEKMAPDAGWICARIELNVDEYQELDYQQRILGAIASMLKVGPIQIITSEKLIEHVTELRGGDRVPYRSEGDGLTRLEGPVACLHLGAPKALLALRPLTLAFTPPDVLVFVLALPTGLWGDVDDPPRVLPTDLDPARGC